MSSIFDLTRNFSLYTIPVAWALSLAPHVYAVSLYQSASSKSFDNTKPRALVTKLPEDQTLDQVTKDRIVRAEGAQMNGFENLSLYAAAVLAGNMANLDNSWLNMLSGGYLASRVLYNLVYVNNESSTAANARTAIYMGGMGMIMTLFVQAGNKFRLTV
ncbi:hypothetical protein MMC24_005749 [Lignoscripta atroalba]|nr:hypothetical protein [Lignoscripta atroalba]